MHLKVHGNRFYVPSNKYSYPISVVIYDHINILGYFNPEFYELGFHKKWMKKSSNNLKNVIRHELAHYLTYIEYNDTSKAHGKEFQSVCKKYNWDTEISKASVEFDKLEDICLTSTYKKIQKLLSLSDSSNFHEANSAMVKAQKIALENNIDLQKISEPHSSDEFILKRILQAKKHSSKQRAIAKILETFFVSSIFHKTTSHCYLEILGHKSNIEIASYVASYLDLHLEKLWNHSKAELNLKGISAKNSFFLGVAKGYLEKFDHLRKSYSKAESKALLNLNKSLEIAKKLAYPRLRSSISKTQENKFAKNAGIRTGKSLQITPALKATDQKLLGYILK